jgi:hypothetical protein
MPPARPSDSTARRAATSVVRVQYFGLRDRDMTATVHPRAGLGDPK